MIGHPTDLSVAANGDIYVADHQTDLVLRLGSDGSVRDSIGGSGSGPGEFDGPIAVRAGSEALWVVDEGNGRRQTFDLDGAYVSSAPLIVAIQLNPPTLGPGGSLAMGTVGTETSLAMLVDGSSTEPRSFGEPVVPPPAVYDMPAIKDHIANGGIPDEFRNATLAVEDDRGSIWVALQSDHEIRRYRVDGSQEWTLVLEDESFDAILEDFFRRNAEEESPFAMHMLRYFADVAVVGDEAWLLLNLPPDLPATILRVRPDAVPGGKITVPSAAGAQSFAFDEARQVLYLGVPQDAQVVAARVEQGSVRPDP